MSLWFIAAAVAYFIKGMCGFANTLVFTSILSFGTANSNISPIDLLLGYPANLILTWENRKALEPRVYIPLAALVLAGSIPGALLLKHVDAAAIKVVFGVVVIVLGAEMLLLAAYVGRVTEDSESFKANISAFFIVDNTFRVILYSCLHLLTLQTIKMSLLLIPFALGGLIAGIKCSQKLDDKLVRKCTVILLVISGVSLILKNL